MKPSEKSTVRQNFTSKNETWRLLYSLGDQRSLITLQATQHPKGEVTFDRELLFACEYLQPLLEKDNKKLIRGDIESIPVETDVDVLRRFRGLLYSGKFNSFHFVEWLPVFTLCDMLLWEHGKQLILERSSEFFRENPIDEYIQEVFDTKETTHDLWLLLLSVFREQVSRKSASCHACDVSVLGCYDTLKAGEFMRDKDHFLAKCCLHSLPGATMLEGVLTLEKNTSILNCCYNLSLERKEVVSQADLKSDVVIRYCCAHRDNSAADLAEQIRKYNLNRQPLKFAWIRTLSTELQAQLLHVVLDVA